MFQGYFRQSVLSILGWAVRSTVLLLVADSVLLIFLRVVWKYVPCILTFKSSSHKECDKAVKLLNMTLSKGDNGCDKADMVSEISNITSNQL